MVPPTMNHVMAPPGFAMLAVPVALLHTGDAAEMVALGAVFTTRVVVPGAVVHPLTVMVQE
jgi:hypothetical protein